MNTKKTLGALVVVIVVSALAYLIWGAVMKAAAPLSGNGKGTICTADAMQCPDGSWVGRTGPACEFVCKDATSTSAGTNGTVHARMGEKVSLNGESITPLQVLEDSRCPQGVQCIQAGTVRLKVKIGSGLGASEQAISLNDTVTTESNAISLVAVDPAKSLQAITPEDYVFTFRFSGR